MRVVSSFSKQPMTDPNLGPKSLPVFGGLELWSESHIAFFCKILVFEYEPLQCKEGDGKAEEDYDIVGGICCQVVALYVQVLRYFCPGSLGFLFPPSIPAPLDLCMEAKILQDKL